MPSPVVTAIAPDPRRPGCYVVEVDRGRFASLPEERLADAGLSLEPGQALAPHEFARLQALAEAEGAYAAARRSLAQRGHARFDLRRKLLNKGHRPAAVDQALERLTEAGLLDDAAFAVHFARTRGARGRGPARLLSDLLHQGVDRTVAERAIAQGLEEEGIDPDRAARALAEKRARELADVPFDARRRRVLGYLVRRGYRGREVREMVEEIVARRHDGTAPRDGSGNPSVL